MLTIFLEVAVLTITMEWLTVFILTKTKLIDKFLPKQNPNNSYIQFKSSGIDAHFEGNAIDAVKSISEFFFPNESVEKKVENRIDAAVSKNTEKIIDAMLANKNIQKQMQKQIFETVKKKLSDNIK